MNWQTIGFDKNKKLFERLLAGEDLSHAYIFYGQDMIGKRTFAMEMAGRAGSSKEDVLLIGPADSESGRSIPIEKVRDVKNFVYLSSYFGKYKFIIIDDAHLMTVEAQNALLKILEEPGQSSVFILVTANPELLLPTVNSRCQDIKFAAHSWESVRAMLKNYKLSEAKAEFLIEFANGRIGLVKKIVEEGTYDELENSVRELMNLIKADINGRLAVAQKMTEEKNKDRLLRKVLYWLLYLRTRLNEPKTHKILKNLLVLHEIINKPQFNQRLALENFLVSL